MSWYSNLVLVSVMVAVVSIDTLCSALLSLYSPTQNHIHSWISNSLSVCDQISVSALVSAAASEYCNLVQNWIGRLVNRGFKQGWAGLGRAGLGRCTQSIVIHCNITGTYIPVIQHN